MAEPTNETRNTEEREGERRRAVLIICVCVIALVLLLAHACWRDPNASPGHFEDETEEEIKADLDAKVGSDSMEISVAGVMEIAEGSTTLEARLENVEENHCDQKVRMFLADDPSDVLFESGAIAPGECMRYVELAHPLAEGTHEMVVEFQGYEPRINLLPERGPILGHERFGASCAALVEVRVTGDEQA